MDYKVPKGKERQITDREMVELANLLQGWTKSVYKFGCPFIHLSNSHAYNSKNPFESLPDTEKEDILSHMRHYHGGPELILLRLRNWLLISQWYLKKLQAILNAILKNLRAIKH